jgi:hypothetical protein
MHLSQKLGALIQQYGRFAVHELWVQKGEQQLPSAMYQISLNQPDASLLPIATIPARHLDREHVIARILSWLQSQSHRISQAIQWMSETQDISDIEHFQSLLDEWETRYKIVLQALQEVDPSAQVEEPDTNYQRNVNYRLIDGNIFPVVEPGTLSRDFGPFRIYEVREYRNGEALPPSHDVCFVSPNSDVLRLGNTSLPDMSLSALMSFLYSWLALQERAIQGVKKRLLTATDPELVTRLQKIESWQESIFFPVSHAINNLESIYGWNRESE